MLSERSQTQRLFDSIHMIFWKGAENRSVVAKEWKIGGRADYKGEQGILVGDAIVLYLDYGGSYLTVYVCQNL